MELDAIRDRVLGALPGAQVQVIDARGGDHFHMVIVSGLFADMSRIQRHQMINALFQNDLQRGAIHALQMICKTPGEINADH
jgi:stress-induced morphogen